MADHEHLTPRVICGSDALPERGKGVRFSVEGAAGKLPAFAVRYNGRVYAYLNRCAHVAVELDWMDGDFFDYSKLYLICATHGATYLPDSGACVQGPCPGKKLIPVAIEERDGQILLLKEFHHV